MTCSTHARIYVQWNGGCITGKTSCSQIRLWRRIRCCSKYSITDYTWLWSWVQAFHTLEKKVKPKRWQIWHFRAELHSLRAPSPTQIALLPPYPIAVSSTITTTNNQKSISYMHAKLFLPYLKMTQWHRSPCTPSLWAQVCLVLRFSWTLCVCLCVCVFERERKGSGTASVHCPLSGD